MILKIIFASALCAAGLAAAQVPLEASELDYLTDLPIVLSVSRLPQRLDETPGAVTVLDRAMIRLSGARDVAELMRLVPGFQSSASFERIAPQATYHGAFTSYSNHLQVLVDGRSVYSPYFLGSTEAGLQSVALEDIERIEVLRGSNSAAYGARAMLGVINIVTRPTVDTLGAALGLGKGENGLNDARASFGWGQPQASFRLSVDRRSDDGLKGSNGHNEVSRLNFRADFLPSAKDDIQLRWGGLGIKSGKGEAIRAADPLRDQDYSAGYVQVDWRRNLTADEDVAFHASMGQEIFNERALINYAPGISINVDGSGRSSSDVLSFEHTLRKNAAVRLIWGAEWRRELISSRGLYFTDAQFPTSFYRIFSNLEWRLNPQLVMNAGAMVEKSSISGASVAPRLMFNWHALEGQTLRAGVSRAYRPPSTFENFADVRFVTPFGTVVETKASGNLVSESVLSKELGYLGRFPRLAASLDVRVFDERMANLITRTNTGLPGAAIDVANTDSYAITGLEFQLKWRPWASAELVFNQARTKNSSLEASRAFSAPRTASTLALFQQLPGGLHLSLTHQDQSLINLPGSNANHLTAITRTDARLSGPLRLGGAGSEWALVVQNLGNPYPDFFPQFQFERRAFMTLRLVH